MSQDEWKWWTWNIKEVQQHINFSTNFVEVTPKKKYKNLDISSIDDSCLHYLESIKDIS